MKEKIKWTLWGVGGILGALLIFFLFGLYGLGWMKFFEPRKENIRRQVFEETKSYTHGKIQDLAKYFEEYQKAETMDDREAVVQIIKLRFAEFDASHINSPQLKQFLVSVRGF